MDALAFDWRLVLDNFLRIGAAYALALPVAWERERSDRSAGLRTFPLVAIASAGFVLIGVRMADSNSESLSRIIQGLMTGIGFIGGGAILKQQGQNVRGTATAASVWATGAIGAATALGRYEIAIVLSVTTFATLRLLRPLKESIRPRGAGDESEPNDENGPASGDRGSAAGEAGAPAKRLAPAAGRHEARRTETAVRRLFSPARSRLATKCLPRPSCRRATPCQNTPPTTR